MSSPQRVVKYLFWLGKRKALRCSQNLIIDGDTDGTKAKCNKSFNEGVKLLNSPFYANVTRQLLLFAPKMQFFITFSDSNKNSDPSKSTSDIFAFTGYRKAASNLI